MNISDELQKVIHSSKVIVYEGKYAYLQCNSIPDKGNDFFMITQDKDEITLIVKESDISNYHYAKDYTWFTLLEIQVSKPFIAKGFLASITHAIASQDLNVLIVSTFSKDYVLVKHETHTIAIEALKQIGFPIQYSQ